jgi:hypothetical protein
MGLQPQRAFRQRSVWMKLDWSWRPDREKKRIEQERRTGILSTYRAQPLQQRSHERSRVDV